MSDDQHVSVPGAAGSIPVRASIQLTPAQYYTRLVGAFVVGAALGAGAAYAMKAALSEEPPIRVRPGSIDLVVPSNHKWQERTDASGQKYWQIRNADKTATEYDLVITTTAPARCDNDLEHSTPKIRFLESDGDYFDLQIVNRRTKVTAKDPNKVLLSGDRRVLTLNTGDYVAKVIDLAKNDDLCVFQSNEFVGASVF
jgi:hypothetical protein